MSLFQAPFAACLPALRESYARATRRRGPSKRPVARVTGPRAVLSARWSMVVLWPFWVILYDFIFFIVVFSGVMAIGRVPNQRIT